MKPKRITYWSFSVYNKYKKCPLTAKLSVIDKIKEPGNKYMDRGNVVHKGCERYVKGEVTWPQLLAEVQAAMAKLQGVNPVDLAPLRPELERLRKIYVASRKKLASAQQATVEETWAFTSGWDETVWNDWIGCWVRIKLDVGHFETIKGRLVYVPTDWKTGKFYEEQNDEYVEQLELYALAALLLHPHVDEVRPRLVYTDALLEFPDPDDPYIFTQADVPRLKELWAKRTKAMLSDTRFAPRPGDYCRFCFFRKSNAANGGGQCKY